ncbi:lipopolysaccharide biosynthesis protein [Frankia sp. QA3]|uniref:lipopolysaccharide biosynthesis protein n=1 Tax=Frankia sp. QA3 TaxID=710111 RepID=UPI000269CD75|nr:hypothetical protein [Frankia sp. QA3]EIV95672.1 hypothetical protein FraQA3DRAFT_5513 [Frankia sp. QA3]
MSQFDEETIYITRRRTSGSGPVTPDAMSGRGNGVARLLIIVTSLLGTQLGTSLLGAVFWSMAARTFSVEAVGVGAAAVSSMTVLGTIGMLGLGTLLMVHLPHLPEDRRLALVRVCLVLVMAAGFGLGLSWAICSRWLSTTLQPIGHSPVTIAIFALGVAGFAVTTTLDYAILRAASGAIQLIRNLLAAVVRAGLLAVFALTGLRTGMHLYATWLVASVVSLPVCYKYFRRPRYRNSRRQSRRTGLAELQSIRGEVAGNYVLSLALTVPTLILPVIAALTTSSADTARFSTARLAASFLFVIPYALPTALLAHTGRAVEDARDKMRLTIPLGLLISIGLAALTAPTAKLVLSPFGENYTDDSSINAFRILALATIALVIKDHYVTLRRVQGRMAAAARLIVCGTMIEIALAAGGGHLFGTTGLCVGWVCAVFLEAIVVAPMVLSVWRRDAARPSPQPGEALPGRS